jgi:hypothetical protein
LLNRDAAMTHTVWLERQLNPIDTRWVAKADRALSALLDEIFDARTH